MMNLADFTSEKYIKIIKSRDKLKAIEELAFVFENTGVCSDIGSLVNALKEREEIMSTGIGLGMAIPHAKIKAVNKMAFAIGILNSGIEFDSIDGKPVHLIILVAAGEGQHKEYLKLLSKIMTILKNEKIRKKIIESSTEEEVFEAFGKM